MVRTVDEGALVPDESLSIDEGAVLPWGSLMWDLMKQVCGAMGVRTDVPFSELTVQEREIVFHGPMEKKHILYKAKKGEAFAETGLHLLQRGEHGEERPVQGQGREGPGAGGALPQGGRLPRPAAARACPTRRAQRCSTGMTLADGHRR